MIEWLGIGHLFELSGTEKILGFLTPLVVFVAFALAQLILPGQVGSRLRHRSGNR